MNQEKGEKMTSRTIIDPDTAKGRILKVSPYLPMNESKKIEQVYKSIPENAANKAQELECLAEYAEACARAYRWVCGKEKLWYNPCEGCPFGQCDFCSFYEAQERIKAYRIQEKEFYKQSHKMRCIIKNLQQKL